jgi:SAM-dependent methyltransferase
MKPETITALNRINRSFYDRHGYSFSSTRRKPWPGWTRLAERVRRLQHAGLEHGRHSILDIGCGNGRFGRFLGEQIGSFDYLGVDASLGLLAEARSLRSPKGAQAASFTADLIEAELPLQPSRSFTLVALFGFLHHVPSHEGRRDLLRATADRLRPGGLLAVSFWQFGSEERFERRRVPWEAHNRQSEVLVDTADLEAGDVLLAWGEGGAYRYCHFVEPEEADRLAAATGLEPVDSYRADGRTGDLNLYHVFQR